MITFANFFDVQCSIQADCSYEVIEGDYWISGFTSQLETGPTNHHLGK